MYIPQFLAGVLSTLFVEVVLLIIAAIIAYTKDKK